MNPESAPSDIVSDYLTAIGQREFEHARGFLADKRFDYVSPIGSYDDADIFIANIARIGPILARMKIRHQFAEGSLVCSVLDVTTAIAETRTQTVVHLARVDDGRIVGIELIFDASDYHRMFQP